MEKLNEDIKKEKMATAKGCKRIGKKSPRTRGGKCGPKYKRKPTRKKVAKKRPVKKKRIFDDSVLDIFR